MGQRPTMGVAPIARYAGRLDVRLISRDSRLTDRISAHRRFGQQGLSANPENGRHRFRVPRDSSGVDTSVNAGRLGRTWRSECLVRDHGWAKVRDGDDTDGWIPSEVPTPSKSTDSVWSRSSTGMHINLILLS